MVEENQILRKLLVEERDVIKDLSVLVDRVSEIFRIEKPSGRIVFMNFGELSDPQRLASLLLGRYFANKLALVESNSLGISEIAEQLGRPKTALSGPLKELVTKGFVEKLPDRKYRIAYNRIRDIFDTLLVKTKK